MSFVVSAHWRAIAGAEARVAEILEEMTAASRQEDLCRHYRAHRDLGDPAHFFLYEEYESEAGYAAHMASEHFARLVRGEALALLTSRHRQYYETLTD